MSVSAIPRVPSRPPRLSPARFLRALGIRRRPDMEGASNAYWRAVMRAGGNPLVLERHSGFSPEAGTVFFASERVGRLTLGSEYDFLLAAARFVRRLCRVVPAPRRVVDLGGGTGIVSMYLAATLSECQVVVYDHAPRQLELGRAWAAGLGLTNVRFVEQSYDRLARGAGPGGNDLVLFLRGMELALPAPGTRDRTGRIPDDPPARPDRAVQAPIAAAARLLGPAGVAVVAGNWSGWGLVSQLEAVRRAGLGVDWRLTSRRPMTAGALRGRADSFLVVRPGVPHLARSSRDDALAFAGAAHYAGGAHLWDGPEVAARADWLGGADELLAADGRADVDGVRRLRLFHRDGRLVLEGSADGRPCWAEHTSLAGVRDMLETAQGFLDAWQADPGGLRRCTIRPRLTRWIKYCRANPVDE